MLTRKLTPFKEEGFLGLRQIMTGCDAAFANLEGTVHTWDEGTPGITQGTFMTTEPKLLDDLKWLGINIVSCANNHASTMVRGECWRTFVIWMKQGLCMPARARISRRREPQDIWIRPTVESR